MIRLGDAFVLAYTKLRVHRIRTAIAVGVAGLLFGLIAAVIIVAQGIFSSVDNFSDEGLNNRTILSISHFDQSVAFNEYDHREDPAFIIEVEAAHKAVVAKKTAAAKKYGIPYNAETEDPSPVMVDPKTKKKVIKDTAMGDSVVLSIANGKREAGHKPLDMAQYLSKSPSAKVIQTMNPLEPTQGDLTYMKDGKEAYTQEARTAAMNANPPALMILDGSLSKPFISNTAFDASKGEIPVIIPYSSAEKLLGYKKLDGGTPMKEKLNRLQEVRNRIGEVTATYCYRNNASAGLLARALTQQAEMKEGAADPAYVKPAVIYTIPEEKTCGAVTVATDTRTAAQKKQEAQFVLYEKEIGTYIGEPEQYLVTVRGVGITGEVNSTGLASIADMTQSLFGSWLGYGTWTIPADLLAKVPDEKRPEVIFNPQPIPFAEMDQFAFFKPEMYIVEFDNKEEARALIKGSALFGAYSPGETFAYPFGSSILIVDELRALFEKVLTWTFLVIGVLAVIILASIIGRTVSEGRRESSIFRAIGASRLDIGSIYGTYVMLLSVRIIVFALLMGIAAAFVIEMLFWQEATLGARLAYAANDITKEFHLFSLNSPYLLWIAGVILVASIVASIIPILLGARRNPIKDMRNDT